jgi:hypothetical protein
MVLIDMAKRDLPILSNSFSLGISNAAEHRSYKTVGNLLVSQFANSICGAVAKFWCQVIKDRP